ncbi:NAD(P)H-hydrate dehydratase [Zoogloea sp.]|uniref:NAD(P)H-hydrate dehydratase n=1 Tax=Zoogloea sp. TaxID=49181 RepID=UPI0035AEF654
MPQPIHTVASIRAIEALTLPGAVPPLMERAGAAAAAVALSLLPPSDAPVLVACGPGNNGGDGFVVARHLRSAGHRVSVAFAADPTRLPADAAVARAAWLAAGGSTDASLPPPPPQGWALVVDALFGIGLQRPIEGLYADWIENLSASSGLRLALDIPSGLDADTGHHPGACFRADHTVTFIALKPGLLTLDGPDHCGTLHLATLDLDTEALVAAPGHTVATELFSTRLHPRQRNSHKGSYGDAALIGGAPGMVGAALLAGRAAAYLGAGRVLVGLLDPAALAVDVERPELMFRDAATLLGETGLGALGVGPGLGQSDAARTLVATALAASPPLLLDADALNLVAQDSQLQAALAGRAQAAVLTPHPAEAARLLGSDAGAVQADRISAACALARRFRAWVVLKGCGSVIAGPDGSWWINTSGNPAMATAGMGDVLTGIICALLARGWPPGEALLAGVHLHGVAADTLCAEQGLDTGLLAGEVAEAARRSLNHWLRACAPARQA